MARIIQVLTVPTRGGYYYEDLAVLQDREIPEFKRFRAKPITPGFQKVREPAEALSVGLVLDNGIVAWGECASVAYGGTAGRDPVFRALEGQERIQETVRPICIGRDSADFLSLAQEVEELIISVEQERLLPKKQPGAKISRRDLFKSAGRMLSGSPETEKVSVQRQLHTAIRYGVSQALFQAAALDTRKTITEIICREWDLPLPRETVPLHAQCGSNRYRGAEKMIVRGIPSLPHSLVDEIDKQLGKDAVKLIRYVKWLKKRIRQLGSKGYHPTIHLDLHGGLGRLYENNLGKVLGAIVSLEKAAQPYPLRIECPLRMDSRGEQIQAMQTLREYLRFRNMGTELVVDEWADTLEDIRAFLEHGAADMIHIKMPDLGSLQNTIKAALEAKSSRVGTLLGGSCAETDASARISAQVALALQPDLILAKPGLGIDEGIAIVGNEMARTLARINHSHPV